jgi:hypothetical protein
LRKRVIMPRARKGQRPSGKKVHIFGENLVFTTLTQPMP